MKHHPLGQIGEGFIGHPGFKAHLPQDRDSLFLPLPDEIGHHKEPFRFPQTDQQAHGTPSSGGEARRGILRDHHACRQRIMHAANVGRHQALLRQQPLGASEGPPHQVRD